MNRRQALSRSITRYLRQALWIKMTVSIRGNKNHVNLDGERLNSVMILTFVKKK
jgi:hypothetical protein